MSAATCRTDRAMKKLSVDQVETIIWLYNATKWYLESGNLTEFGKISINLWGVPWRPAKENREYGYGFTRGDSAVWSRSLKRLEDRGLLLRINDISGSPDGPAVRQSKEDPPPRRTTRVKITPLGLEVAEILMERTS